MSIEVDNVKSNWANAVYDFTHLQNDCNQPHWLVHGSSKVLPSKRPQEDAANDPGYFNTAARTLISFGDVFELGGVKPILCLDLLATLTPVLVATARALIFF